MASTTKFEFPTKRPPAEAVEALARRGGKFHRFFVYPGTAGQAHLVEILSDDRAAVHEVAQEIGVKDGQRKVAVSETPAKVLRVP